ncbi:MAG: hypothetical protein PHR06_00725 [Candidatus Cloacimonetes bacterium]|nr:hypothetical protein [Candidatus Cloacimonadota bacterium]
MRKYTLTIIMALLLLNIFATEPASMRSAATGTIFEGEWEKVYDPIELRFMPGIYFFTSLSDFNFQYYKTYDEFNMISKQQLLEEFPFGIAFENPFVENLKHALLYRTRALKTSNTPESEDYQTDYIDNNNDGIFDIRRVSYTKEIDYVDDNCNGEFIFNNNYVWNEYTFGAKLHFSKEKYVSDDSANMYGDNDSDGFLEGLYGNSKEYWIELYNAGESNYYRRIHERGDFNLTHESNNFKILLSAMKPYELLNNEYEIRLDGGFNRYLNSKTDRDDKYVGEYVDVIVRDTLEETGNVKEYYSYVTEISENDLFLMMHAKRIFQKGNNRINDGFWSTGIGFGLIGGVYDNTRTDSLYSVHMINDIFNDSNDSEYMKSSRISEKNDGDFTGVHFDLYGKINLPLNEFADFGFAGYYTFTRKNRTTDYIYTRTRNELLQYGEEFDSGDEYMVHRSQKTTADQEFISKTTDFRAPVALEFRIPTSDMTQSDGFGIRNFIFRIGTIFTYQKYYSETAYKYVENLPFSDITYYGNGDIEENHDNENYLLSHKSKSENIRTNKVYTGGIGYKHSENVSIDLGGYINENSSDYYVGLSFTIKK